MRTSDPVIQLITIPEAAERLRLSRRTVERLIRAGRIRPVRIGRRVLVTERELAAFVALCSGRRVA